MYWCGHKRHYTYSKEKQNTTQSRLLQCLHRCRQLYAQTMFTLIYTHHYSESIPKPRPLLEASCYVCFSLNRGRSKQWFAHAQSYSIQCIFNCSYIRIKLRIYSDLKLNTNSIRPQTSWFLISANQPTTK